MARGDLGRHMALVGCPVGQHRVAGDIADGENVLHVGPAARINGDDASLVHLDPGSGGIYQRTVRAAAN